MSGAFECMLSQLRLVNRAAINLFVSLNAGEIQDANIHYSLRRIPRARYTFAFRLQAVWHVVPAEGKAWLRCKLASSLLVRQIIFAFCHYDFGLICVKAAVKAAAKATLDLS